MEFDQTGNYLATGDKGGRVVLFERNESVRQLLLTVDEPLTICTEKDLRIQVPHRVPIARARVRLPQITRDRRED